MSILGPIGTGLTIGAGMADVCVKYSKHQYQEKIDKLDSCLQRLGQELSNLEDLKRRLPAVWVSNNSERYIKAIEKEIQSVKNAQDNVQNQITMWKEAIREMEEDTSEQTEKIEAIKHAIDVLDIKD